MKQFDFSKVQDLSLSDKERAVVNVLFNKARVNEQKWLCSEQQFFEAFIRCLSTSVSCNAVPSCVAAQAILESGWFSTDVLFGVKATRTQEESGQVEMDATNEVVNNKVLATTGSFFHGGIQQQFANYFAYLSRRKPGTAKFCPSDQIGYMDHLQDPMTKASDGSLSGAYSTAGQAYIDSILGVINGNGLSAFNHL